MKYDKQKLKTCCLRQNHTKILQLERTKACFAQWSPCFPDGGPSSSYKDPPRGPSSFEQVELVEGKIEVLSSIKKGKRRFLVARLLALRATMRRRARGELEGTVSEEEISSLCLVEECEEATSR